MNIDELLAVYGLTRGGEPSAVTAADLLADVLLHLAGTGTSWEQPLADALQHLARELVDPEGVDPDTALWDPDRVEDRLAAHGVPERERAQRLRGAQTARDLLFCLRQR